MRPKGSPGPQGIDRADIQVQFVVTCVAYQESPGRRRVGQPLQLRLQVQVHAARAGPAFHLPVHLPGQSSAEVKVVKETDYPDTQAVVDARIAIQNKIRSFTSLNSIPHAAGTKLIPRTVLIVSPAALSEPLILQRASPPPEHATVASSGPWMTTTCGIVSVYTVIIPSSRPIVSYSLSGLFSSGSVESHIATNAAMAHAKTILPSVFMVSMSVSACVEDSASMPRNRDSRRADDARRDARCQPVGANRYFGCAAWGNPWAQQQRLR